MSNILVSALRKAIPEKVRIAAYVVIIATFVTIVQMVLQAFVPSLYASLGLFIPLIVVNCIILARAEAFASKNSVGKAALDGFGMGIGFTASLCIISIVRELLGAGTIWGVEIIGGPIEPMAILGMPPGGFIVLGIIIAIINYLSEKKGGNE